MKHLAIDASVQCGSGELEDAEATKSGKELRNL